MSGYKIGKSKRIYLVMIKPINNQVSFEITLNARDE